MDTAQYAKRLDHFLVANGITDPDRKGTVFLSVIGPKSYKLLSSLVTPGKPGEKTYGELVKRWKNTTVPHPPR